MDKINISARVAQRNTPETDAMSVVKHIVEYTTEHDGMHHSVTVYAADPMDAINIVIKGE